MGIFNIFEDNKRKREIEQQVQLENAKNQLQALYNDLTGTVKELKTSNVDLENKVMEALDAGDEDEASIICYELSVTRKQLDIFRAVRMKVNEKLVDIRTGSVVTKLSTTMRDIKPYLEIKPEMLADLTLNTMSSTNSVLSTIANNMKSNNYESQALLAQMKERYEASHIASSVTPPVDVTANRNNANHKN
jgi:phage shock protein A